MSDEATNGLMAAPRFRADGPAANLATGDQDIDGVLQTSRWNGVDITYNFPALAAFYSMPYGGYKPFPAGFAAVSPSFQTMVRDALAEFSAVSGLHFIELAEDDSAALLSIARTTQLGPPDFRGYGYGPAGQQRAGDSWFAASTQEVADSKALGHATWSLVLHELGHTLGLKHGHDAGGVANVTMTRAHDFGAYSLMSYRTFEGSPTSSRATTYGNPQTLMMYDIAALQVMYGANYAHHAGNTIYKVDPNTGRFSVDGVNGPLPGANTVYRTIWDGGGTDTYDLSAYTNGVVVDLSPGAFSTLSEQQLAIVSQTGERAIGNLFNALLFEGNPQSLIENAIGGSGDDIIQGNIAPNTLWGGDGNDFLAGHAGDDLLFGGDGVDTIYGGDGDDYIQGDGGAYSTLVGGDGNDIIYGDAGNDYIVGDDGNDVLVGLGAQDSLYGGEGDDYLVAGPGIWLAYTTGTYAGAVLDGGSGADRLWGGSGDDYIVGGEGQDLLVGGSGSDYLFGGAGDDVIYGGYGIDYIFSGPGNDFIWTDEHDPSVLRYEGHPDYIYVGGGTGVDTIADFNFYMYMGSARDTLVIAGSTGLTSFSDIEPRLSRADVYTVVDLGSGDQVFIYNPYAIELKAHHFMFL